MAKTTNNDKWYFTKDQLENIPSRQCGFDAYKELSYRQQAANFIQDMGQKLQVSQLCINTAIVYMHRFYVFHSFTNFPWHQMAAAALFLAAKVEEQPRKLEYVIKMANICKNPKDRSIDINSERYIAQSQDLVFNENVLLQTLGFDVAIDHPHTYVVKCCHLVRASKDLAQTSYFMASNSLHLTTMCIQYKPTVVACFCILLACKWSNWEIPLSNEKKEWYTYVDPTVTAELLQQLTNEFLVIFENCPSRLKEKILAKQESSSSPFEQEKKLDNVSQRSLEYKGDDPHKHRNSRPPEATSSGHRNQEQREREYKERKEKERIAHMSGITMSHPSHHHRLPNDPNKLKPHSRPPSSGPSFPPSNRNEPRDILREATKDSPFGLPTIRDHSKDPYAARSDKEVSKRDPLLKSNVQTDPNSLTNLSDVRQQRMDPSRPRVDPSKSAPKQDGLRRYDEQKVPHVKTETDNIKKHLNSYEKNSAYVKTSSSSTSQKVKSPFNLDSKSVPKTTNPAHNRSQFNGNTNGSYSKLPVPQEAEAKNKTELPPSKEEIPVPPVIKRPSLFSPEQTPQHPQLPSRMEPIPKGSSLASHTDLSPINSPPSVPSMRNRNYSTSSSEPELRPTMKKIDQVEGFENLMRDNTIGMATIHNPNDSLSSKQEEKVEIKAEHKTPTKDVVNTQSAIVNGLETNPTLISNLLKEVATTSHLPGVATTMVKQEPTEVVQNALVTQPENSEKEHRHHKSKKKKEKHKHKDKDKNREEKEKKKKHKDKDREKHKHRERKEEHVASEPIKIKIQKDKIQPINQLKIKIPKDKIKTEGIVDPLPMPQPSTGGLKIKIPKEVITNCNANSSFNAFDISLSSSSSGRKRDRDRTSPSEVPPLKMLKSSHKESKQNGRHSFSKVSNNKSSSISFPSTDQVHCSISADVGNEFLSNLKNSHSSTNDSENAHSEENNNDNLYKSNPENKVQPISNPPSTPKVVSSSISPTLLSPISPSDSPLSFFNAPVLSPMPLSPISSRDTHNLEQNLVATERTSSNPPHRGSSEEINEGNIDNVMGEIRSTTPPGHPPIKKIDENIQCLPNADMTSNNSSLPSAQYHTNTASLPQLLMADTNIDSKTQASNKAYQYKYIANNNNNTFHNTQYKTRHPTSFPQQHNRTSQNYYPSLNTPPPPPPFQMSVHRSFRHMNPRYAPPSHYPHVSQNLPPSLQIESTYAQLPQNHENSLHYTTPAYNAFSVAPPFPNVNVPPPNYNLYSGYYGGYMYPDTYTVGSFSGMTQPPLPTDAPPSNEIPPPPPPE